MHTTTVSISINITGASNIITTNTIVIAWLTITIALLDSSFLIRPTFCADCRTQITVTVLSFVINSELRSLCFVAVPTSMPRTSEATP